MSPGPPEVPIHLVPPLGGLLSTRGGHGKELQPCFTIRDNHTDREQPTPAQDNEPDPPPRPPPKTRPHHKALENLPNLPFPFVKATCRFGATEPTESGRPQRPLQDIVAFGTVKDLADAVDGLSW